MNQAKKMAAIPVVALCALAGLAGPAAGQDQPEPAAIDTAATHALDRMAKYLQSLDAFQVRAEVTTEEVLTDGQKIQLATVADLVADRPNRLRMTVANDRHYRLWLYDGTKFVLSAPRLNFYAEAPAPPTIRELVDEVEEKLGLEAPFVDLVRWGDPSSDFEDITSAKVIGPSEIGGVTTEHYAFRQEGLDWQIWIQKGEFPLPRKLVLTTLTDDARPQHESIYTWNLAPSYNDASFTFVPTPEAKKIPFQETGVVASAQ